jgi:hypothetical protein
MKLVLLFSVLSTAFARIGGENDEDELQRKLVASGKLHLAGGDGESKGFRSFIKP